MEEYEKSEDNIIKNEISLVPLDEEDEELKEEKVCEKGVVDEQEISLEENKEEED